jgi:ribonuclease HI
VAATTLDTLLIGVDLQIWTDGSVKEDQKKGGAGALLALNNGDIDTFKAPAGAWCSSYTAEMKALRLGLEKALSDNRIKDTKNILVCLDNKQGSDPTP